MPTNYDRLKTLSINEMSELLVKIAATPCFVCDAPECKEDYKCKDGWDLWLRKEVKEQC